LPVIIGTTNETVTIRPHLRCEPTLGRLGRRGARARPRFLDELTSERDRDRATYEEVEESGGALERFRSWLAKIDRRDHFVAPRRADAHAAVERCARALEAFESKAFARDAQPAADAPALRTVQNRS
jgi:hypothetical protein